MRTVKFALFSATVAAFALAGASANAATERHYDCTKAGNATKAECKAAAAAAKPGVTPAPAAKPAPVAAAKPAPTPAAAPVAMAKPAKPPKPPKAAPGTRSPAQLANDNKMKACGAKWGALNAAQKASWDTKGAAKKDKNGKPETGWIAYSVECRKGAA